MNKALVAAAALVVSGAAAVGVTQLAGSAESWKGSLNASIQQAASGDTITVPPGTYPGETIAPSSKSLTVKADGASFGSLTFTGVKNLTLDGITGTGLFTLRSYPVLGTVSASSQRTGNILVTNADLKTLLFRNVDGVTLRDSRVGGQNVSTSGLGVPKVGGYPSATGAPYMPSTNVLIERVFFHDIIRTVTGSTHAECFFADGGTDGIIIRASEFTNCGVFDVFGGPSSAGGIANVTVEDSLLDIPRDTVGAAAASAINFKGGATNLVFRRNSILGAIRLDAAAYPGLVKERNAFSGFVSASTAPCGPQPWDGSCYRNDLHVTSGSDGVPVPAPPPPPPPVTTETVPDPPPVTTAEPAPVCVAPVLGWKLPTRATITLTWDAVPDTTGYRLLKNGVPVATAGAAAVSAKFGNLPYADTALGVAAICADGDKVASLTTFETRAAR